MPARLQIVPVFFDRSHVAKLKQNGFLPVLTQETIELTEKETRVQSNLSTLFNPNSQFCYHIIGETLTCVGQCFQVSITLRRVV